MDLGIRGRKAIVCAASEGLGRACALALAREGVGLAINARRPDVLEAIAEEIRRRLGRVVNITTSGVKGPALYQALGLSIAVRSGLTGLMAVLARQTAGQNVTVNALLSGKFDTERLLANLRFAAGRTGRTLDKPAKCARANVPAGRLGNPDEFGAACAFLLSVHAGFITGQNIVLDSGAFPGLF
jgi:3-oxoacyl-[acyl-carrier protein] reductase